MLPRRVASAALIAAVGSCLPAAGAAVRAAEITIGAHTFTVPDGFDIELAAGPPLVERPITMAFDEEGRLYVTDSSGDSSRGQQQLERRSHRVRRLEDSDGDGIFDKSVLFAENLMFPEGSMWLDGSLHVAAPPSIWKLTDTDDDGVADHREEWFQGKTLTGCANDLHGPYLGVDGHVYWCKGAFAEQTHERPGKEPFVTRAAHIFRRHRDGGPVEPVMTGGMDNPVDVTFLPSGERFFTTTFLQHPAQGRRDGIIHALHGGVYGKEHGVLDGHPRTGGLLPPLVHLGAAAPCGLTAYRSTVFGRGYRDNLFATLFNMRKVTRHVLSPAGAAYTSTTTDFLVSESRDFHPTDVLEDADGSLLVANTGGWYKICCPTSQLRKSDVLGGIYRVRRVGAPPSEDPRGRRVDWDEATPHELVRLLDDERVAVQERAVEALGLHAERAVEALAGALRRESGTTAQVNAVWALARIDAENAREATRYAAERLEEPVRRAALHSIALRRDGGAVRAIASNLRHGTPALRRVAAEAAGRVGHTSLLTALRDATTPEMDWALEHSLIYALIELDSPAETGSLFLGGSPTRRLIGLRALDQMPSATLEPGTILSDLDRDDPTGRWAREIALRHPEWSAALITFFTAERLRKAATDERAGARYRPLLSAAARRPAFQQHLARALSDRSSGRAILRIVLEAVADAGVERVDASLVEAVEPVLLECDQRQLQIALSALRRLKIPAATTGKMRASLLSIASDERRDEETRLLALDALPGGPGLLEDSFLDLALGNLHLERDFQRRSVATRVLTSTRLGPEQDARVFPHVSRIGPMEIGAVFGLFAERTDDETADGLVRSILSSPGRHGLRASTVREWLAKTSEVTRRRAAALLRQIDPNVEERRKKVDSLARELPAGDVRRGELVFNGEKTACHTCHRIGYLGGTIGPDLTRIGGIRSGVDLLEALVYPSAGFVRSYEPTTIVTRAGEVHNGIVRHADAGSVDLITGATTTERIRRDDIVEQYPGETSTMPAGLTELLNRQQLADLLAFLRAAR